MFWTVLLPLQVTVAIFGVSVIVFTVFGPCCGWNRTKSFFLSMLSAVVLFVPALFVVGYGIDSVRFGVFEYGSVKDIGDLRARRYLPIDATNIEMEKYASGYRARYCISETDFHSYLDDLWGEYGASSAHRRGSLSGEEMPVDFPTSDFNGLPWPNLSNAIEYRSPSEGDGGGAVYYYDASIGVAYQRTSYW